ncbi:hypothetical protein [Oricola indica]|jgi:hypothetical protein|uniref:hypothetical protein n=1 Tax=Oricola indica TaxID=2872591 RepID=UPI001CBE7176|nr:hypothetical protein [Oricola indica]
MIGQVVFGLWVAAVTLGGIYLGQQMAPEPAADGTVAVDHTRYNDFKTDLFAIPYVNETGIVGYVTGRFTVKTVAREEAALGLPLNTVMLDALSRHFYAEADKLAHPDGWSRLRESMQRLREIANETAGREVVADVLIEQLDFFDKNSVRVPGDSRFESSENR